MSLSDLEKDILAQVEGATDEASLEAVRVAALGKKGSISERMKSLGGMSPDERREVGAALNVLKDKVAEALSTRKAKLQEIALEARLASEKIDVTLPVRPQNSGTVHPVSQVWEEVVQIFGDLGFSVAEGPHIEDDFHNFDALNIPPEHPARQEHDTFFFNEKPDGSRMLLRTHTSPVQIRTMLASKPPIRIIAPGRTFRCDSDMTHTPMFNQVEGLILDETTTLANLKWILAEFCKAFFEVDDVKMRFRASHFPFTEPSMEVDIQYSREGGQLKIGTGDKWLEILGSRHGASERDPRRRHGPRQGSGLGLRHGHRPHRHAEIRHPRSCAPSSRLICAGSPLWIQGAAGADASRRAVVKLSDLLFERLRRKDPPVYEMHGEPQ